MKQFLILTIFALPRVFFSQDKAAGECPMGFGSSTKSVVTEKREALIKAQLTKIGGQML